MAKIKLSSEEAFKLFDQVKRLEQIRRNALFNECLILEELRVANAAKQVLNEEASFLDILAQPDILVSRNIIYNTVKAWETLKNLGAKMNDVNITALNRLVPIAEVATVTDVEEWIKKANTLSPQDFKDEINEALGKVTTEDCKHTFEEFDICKICGKKQHK